MESIIAILKITRTEKDGALYFGLDGALGAKGVHQIRESVIPELQSAKKVVLDFEELTFLSSAGIGILVMAKKMADQAGCELQVQNVPPKIHEVLQMTGMLKIFNIKNETEDN